MNKFLMIIFGLLCLTKLTNAQPYGNEWIEDYDKTYYKFTVNEDKLYRIPYSTLSQYFDDAELIGANFQLFGRGEEIAIYVSTDDQFSSTDYIEFYGEKNDGELDVPLYKEDENLHEEYSLYNDNAAYFLLLNNAAHNKRLTPKSNDITGLSPEPYFWYTSLLFFTNVFDDGQPLSDFGDLSILRDSRYDKGEGYTGTVFTGPATRNRNLSTPAVYRGDNTLSAQLRHVHVTKSFNNQHESILTVGSSTFTYSFFAYGVRKILENIPVSDVSTGTTTVGYRENNALKVADALVAIKYPRTFDFSNATTFKFEVQNTSPTLLQISNFNAQSTTPVLYDLKNGERYEAVISGNQYQFGLLPVSDERALLLVNQSSSNFSNITSLDSVRFTDYSLPANQGNYIILTHRNLTSSTDGTDYIAAYNDHRSSEIGGSYNSKIAFIQDIENQFGWGVRNHPLAIRRFINYALDNYMVRPEHLFIIGKGITYTSIRNNTNNFNNCLVVSMGTPDSDVFLTARSAENEKPQLSIGRLSAHTGDRVGQYLEKVIEYETALKDTSDVSQTIENKQWMKNVLHLGGGKTEGEQAAFKNYLNAYKQIIEDPLYGANVTSVYKTSTEPIQISTSEVVDSLIETGVSLITFFGHSSTSTIDFDISPEEFDNYGKYNVFLSNGCFVGSIFGASLNTYSDRFIFQNRIGSVAYIAPITLALSSTLNRYSERFYTRMSNTLYGKGLGEVMRSSAEELIQNFGIFDQLLAKQMILHGDPALTVNAHSLPDYAITKQSIDYNPAIVSASSDSFDVVIGITNIGKAIEAEYTINVRRVLPNGSFTDYEKIVPSAVFRDTAVITLPTDRINGLGTNILRIKVDYGEDVAELSENNNEIVDTLIIFADDIIPVLPYEFCISPAQPDKIYFSTASIGTEVKQYLLQMDTTEYFNSPLLVEQIVSSTGGIIEWTPSIPYLENTVYYVRSALDSIIQGDYNWNYSSFLYNSNLSTGWNQSHYFQYKKDDFFTLELEEPDRVFKFPQEQREVRLINALVTGGFTGQDIQFFLDGTNLIRNATSKASFNFFVFDPATGKYIESSPIRNHPVYVNQPECTFGTYDDIMGSCIYAPRASLNYLVNSRFWRGRAMNFIENYIPDGAYVLVYSTQQAGSTYSFNANTWTTDVPFFPRDLYQVFEQDLGATKIRDIQDGRPYLFWTQKGNPDFETIEFHGALGEIIDTTLYFSGNWNVGALQSVNIGPSTGWNSLEFDHYALEDPSFDSVSVSVRGIDLSGNTNTLFEGITDSVFSLSSIDANQYPNLQLELYARDDSNRTAPQLKHWRVLYDKVPEAAVDPLLSYSISADSIDIGQSVSLEAGIRNISDLDMDSLLVRVQLNRTGGSATYIYKRFGELKKGESMILNFDLSSDQINAPGKYVILLEANPDNDQPEQFHFNNYATFLLNVAEDKINPLLDVTFDGVHILDGDIISPRPEITIKLKDENKGLAIKDTNSFELYIYYPDNPNTPVMIDLSADNVTFIPADESELEEKNEAILYYYPNFEHDGIYRLKVQGKDARNNDAGDYDYIVSFEVINETSISNFLNYPNPFSTSTRFVFTLTGAEIPDEVKIQIMTVSGKVVREITIDELGPLKIGKNITEYAWDGTDRYGDKLANGLYIYKVFTRLNGENIEQYKTNADRFFENDGFGKMYIVR
ncbi:MAG: C25 family cysteine peptidase [Chitinophagales bacterium]